jgi:hypothetical protein
MSMAPTQSPVETPSHQFYRDVLELLTRAGIPFLLGGAFAFMHQTGIDKSTKDLDIFVRPVDLQRVLAACRQAGYEADLIFSHWLAKIMSPSGFIDVIFGSGNGEAGVDDGWFEHSRQGELLGLTVSIAPVEETIWSKAFVMERGRYDGADVAHILLYHGARLDWRRLIERFGRHWRVLLSHLVLYGFIYPSARSRVPAWAIEELCDRLRAEADLPDDSEPICNGTLLSWSEYLGDVLSSEFRDGRVRPQGKMTAQEVARWTAADKN